MAFNNDHLIWIEFKNLISKFNVEVIIETGTYKAQSTIDFASLGIPVHTTESRTPFYIESVANIVEAGCSGIILSHLGDSPKILEEIVPPIANDKKRIIFFLDAHWYNDNCLERELNMLKTINFQGVLPVILIHDILVPLHEKEYGYDLYNNRPVSMVWIESIIKQIYGNENYEYHYNTGISEEASHNRGCVFIYPAT